MSPLLAASEGYRWWADLNIWTAVTFAIFAYVLVRAAGKPLTTALRQRQSSVEDQLRQLEEAQREVQALRAEQELRRRELRQRSLAMVEEAKRDAEHTRVEMVERARQEVDKLRNRATREIELAKRKAIHELSDRVNELSIEVARRNIEHQLNDGVHGRLISAAIAEMSDVGGRSRS